MTIIRESNKVIQLYTKVTDLVLCCVTYILFYDDCFLRTETCRNIKCDIITSRSREQVGVSCWFTVNKLHVYVLSALRILEVFRHHNTSHTNLSPITLYSVLYITSYYSAKGRFFVPFCISVQSKLAQTLGSSRWNSHIHSQGRKEHSTCNKKEDA
jgi:hypothetical protein